MTRLSTVVALCRAGFEADLAEEIETNLDTKATRREVVVGSGMLSLTFSPTAAGAVARLNVDTLIFARQIFLSSEAPVLLPNNDRVTPIMAEIERLIATGAATTFCGVWVEYPDTNDGKALSTAARAISPRLQVKLTEMGCIDPAATSRLHVLLTPSPMRRALIGLADLNNSSPWPLGVPRLRFPPGAPSRSTLKLAEALHHFLGDGLDRALAPDMRAVDLGAAPGGWTWQLIHRGVRVTAIDNGALKGDLVDNAMVKHLRMDGFKFAPNVPVDWMVCDMVEQPARIATLVARWLSQGWARHIIFNLKLPMKKRLGEIDRCRAILQKVADETGKPLILSMKQLYHDREEVTAYCHFASRAESGRGGLRRR